MVGPFDIVPGEALAEDTRCELVRGCPNTRSKCSPGGLRGFVSSPDLRLSCFGERVRTLLNGGE
jgi:hypothetical protein